MQQGCRFGNKILDYNSMNIYSIEALFQPQDDIEKRDLLVTKRVKTFKTYYCSQFVLFELIYDLI